MKKVLFTAALFSACTFVIAQDTTKTTGDYKPVAGANNLELNFTPLGGSPISLSYIRYRRFLTATTAVRAGVSLTYSSSSVDVLIPSDVTPGTNITSTSKSSKMGWSLRPGIEKHFAGTNRLSPYVGVELALSGQSTKDVTPTDLNATDDVVLITTTKNSAKGGFFMLGLNALAGFDCYITKHLYLGAELGFGLEYTAFSKLKTESTPAPTTAIPDVDQGSAFNLGPMVNSAIRLGFIF